MALRVGVRSIAFNINVRKCWRAAEKGYLEHQLSKQKPHPSACFSFSLLSRAIDVTGEMGKRLILHKG